MKWKYEIKFLKKKRLSCSAYVHVQYIHQWMNQTIFMTFTSSASHILIRGISCIALLFVQMFYLKDIYQLLLPLLMYFGNIEPLSET